ncbi:hypothetical protein RF11_14735 [Thelohanellus kitauei]|uniref:Uncharacterized protein n=1 Tax=Thelohanellus kitauei TaxID=669202 RepID=A0A0C2ILK0_THEKT|nr:hypothetical protein RF11_14735 [Thelohanellus kitauei]
MVTYFGYKIFHVNLEGDTKTFAFKKNVSNPLLAKKIVLEVNMFVSDLASGKRNFPTRYYYLEHTTDTCTQTMENINTNVYVRDRSDYFSDSSSAIMSVPNEGGKWIKSISDFEIKNIDSELYDRSSAFFNHSTQTKSPRLLCLDQVFYQNIAYFSHLYAHNLNKIGTLWQTTFNGRVVDQHAWAPIYLNQTRSAYVIRRLSVAEREICKAHIFT